ncbi:MAG: hypothetical protein OXG91_03905 [bacterium]|nr:hypothetical protein [bacterium]
MRTLVVTVVAFVVLLAACSRAGEDVSLPTATDVSATPMATGATAIATTEGLSVPGFGVENKSPAHGNDRAGATPLAAPGSVSGAASSGDPDWFVFDAVTDGTYAIDVTPESDGEFTVAVFDEEGQVPGFPVVQVGELDVDVVWVAPTPGRYWLRVSGKWAVRFAYKLRMRFFETPPDDHGDSAAEATAVVLDPGATPAWVGTFERNANSHLDWLGEVQGAVTLWLGDLLDEDWFSLELEEGRRYRIVPVRGDPTRQPVWRLTAFPPLVMTVHRDGDATALHHDRWGFPIEFVPPVTGTYQLSVASAGVVSSLLPAPHAIVVSLFDPDTAPYLRDDTVAVRPGAPTVGTFDRRGDLHWFALDAVEGQTWIVQFGERLDGCIEVYGPASGDPLLDECDRDYVDYYRDYHVWTAPTDGTYGIRLFPDSDRFQTGSARYWFTMTPAAPDDHANHAAGATPVVAGESPTGTIDYVGDTDMFRLPTHQGEVWTIPLVQFAGAGTTVDAWFVSAGGQEDGPHPLPHCYWAWPTCALSAPRDGAWIIAFEGTEPGARFEVIPERLNVPDDYGNDRAHAPKLATPILPGAACRSEPSMDDCSDTTTVEGTIDYRIDGDYFRISLPEVNKYELRLHSDRGHAIFTVLERWYCASWDEAWGQTHDLWIPEIAGDYWIRVGVNRDELVRPDYYFAPEDYTLHITARPDDFPDLPTPEETIEDTATELEPNTVHRVPRGQSSGEDAYRVTLDHPHYIIEIDGAGFRILGTRGSSVQEGSRYLRKPWPPQVDLRFTVTGPEAAPYSVVVRERKPTDDQLDWAGPPHVHPGDDPPEYCYPHDH